MASVARASRLWNRWLPIVLIPMAWWLNPSEDEHLAQLQASRARLTPVAALGDPTLATQQAQLQIRYINLWLASCTLRDQRITSLGAFGKVLPVGRRGRQSSPPP